MVDGFICRSILKIIYRQTFTEIVLRVRFCITEGFQKSKDRFCLLNILQQCSWAFARWLEYKSGCGQFGSLFLLFFFFAIESYNLFDLRPAVLLYSTSVSLTDKTDINMLGYFTWMYKHINVKPGERLQ